MDQIPNTNGTVWSQLFEYRIIKLFNPTLLDRYHGCIMKFLVMECVQCCHREIVMYECFIIESSKLNSYSQLKYIIKYICVLKIAL